MTVVMLRPATATWQALGTTALVRVAEPEVLGEATAILDRRLRRLDQAASRFRSDSELSELNGAAGHWMVVSPLMRSLLDTAVRAAEISDGIVDPAIGWAVIRAGYDRDFEELEPAGPRSADRPGTPRLRALVRRVDWRQIEFDDDRHAVRLPVGMRLDLGATAKAFEADRAAAEIAETIGTAVLVSLGGDIATAGGAPAGGWRVRVADDHRSAVSAPGQTVAIDSGALATSSTTVRRWRDTHGTNHHHIIDPRTGDSAAGRWRTVSATAATCVDANIATTTAVVLGAAAPAWLERFGLSARLVAHDGSVETVGGWPAEAA